MILQRAQSWPSGHARRFPSLQIPSPGFKSDILHGKTGRCGPQPPASSHIWRPLVWNACAVTLDYNTIQPQVLQGFFEIFSEFFRSPPPLPLLPKKRGQSPSFPGKDPQISLGRAALSLGRLSGPQAHRRLVLFQKVRERRVLAGRGLQGQEFLENTQAAVSLGGLVIL